MPLYNDIEKDLGVFNGSKHSVSESDADDTSDTTSTQNSRGLLSNRKDRGRSRVRKGGRFTGGYCSAWLLVLLVQLGMLLLLYQRLPVKQTNFLNGDISHIVPECKLGHSFIPPANLFQWPNLSLPFLISYLFLIKMPYVVDEMIRT